jgi:hypothetical protein
VAGKIRSIEKFNDLIGNRTRYLQACSIMYVLIVHINIVQTLLRIYVGVC